MFMNKLRILFCFLPVLALTPSLLAADASCTIEANHPKKAGIGIEDPDAELPGGDDGFAVVGDYVHWTATLTYKTIFDSSMSFSVTPDTGTPAGGPATEAQSGADTIITVKGSGKKAHTGGAGSSIL
jgi:hypothetical protein